MNILKYINKILMMIIPILIFMFVSTIIYNKLINKEIDIKDKGSTYLKELIIDNHDIVFNKNTEEYFISLNNNETSLSIKAIPEDNSAKVSIFNNDDLTKHDKVYIYVTSKDHEIKKYTINYNNKNAIIYFKTNVEGCSRIDSDYCLKFFNVNSNNNDNFLLFLTIV